MDKRIDRAFFLVHELFYKLISCSYSGCLANTVEAVLNIFELSDESFHLKSKYILQKKFTIKFLNEFSIEEVYLELLIF